MAQMPGGDWPALTDAEEKALAERYAEEIARKFDPESQVRAIDKEGLDLAILFPSSAMYVTAFTKMDPRFAETASRLRDFTSKYSAALALLSHPLTSPILSRLPAKNRRLRGTSLTSIACPGGEMKECRK